VIGHLLFCWKRTSPFLFNTQMLRSNTRLGFNNNLALETDGPQWRKLRRPYGNFLSSRSSLTFRDSQLKCARLMVDEIQKAPAKWQTYFSRYDSPDWYYVRIKTDGFARFTTRVIFSIAFAIEIEDENDPYFTLAEEMGEILSHMGTTAITVLDIAPWRK